MRILALDLSTHTGWAVLESPEGKLVEYGLLEMKTPPENYGVPYPFGYVLATQSHATNVLALVTIQKPDIIVIEETNPGRETYSQKILEFLHCTLLQQLKGLNVVYVRTGAWRKAVDLRMSKEDLKGNQRKNLEKAKKMAKELRAQIKALGGKKANAAQVAELKARLSKLQLGRITRKHLSVRLANSMFGLNFSLLDNDIADAILLGVGFMRGAEICDGLRPMQKKGENDGDSA